MTVTDHDTKTTGLLTVKVFAPRTPAPRKFEWATTTLVGTAAREAANAFGYHPTGAPGFQDKHDRVLDNQQSLEAAGVRNEENLELVDTGGGV
jgi:hypothetical protein